MSDQQRKISETKKSWMTFQFICTPPPSCVLLLADIRLQENEMNKIGLRLINRKSDTVVARLHRNCPHHNINIPDKPVAGSEVDSVFTSLMLAKFKCENADKTFTKMQIQIEQNYFLSVFMLYVYMFIASIPVDAVSCRVTTITSPWTLNLSNNSRFIYSN